MHDEWRETARRVSNWGRWGRDDELGTLNYITGEKTAALKEFQTAQKLDPNFRKQWDAEIDYEKEFAPILQDKEFLKQLFPDGK